MKKILQLFIFVAIAMSANAAFVHNMPVVRLQPNGDTLHCFVTGDEFYHRLHDSNGYTIIQDATSGWYVYADRLWNEDHSDWQLVATTLVPGHSDPSAAGLTPNIIESPSTVDKKHASWEVPPQYVPAAPQSKYSAQRNHGVMNNIVIFVRFADDDNISTPFSTVNAMFNDSSANAVSMHNYFWRASYSQLRIPTSYFPAPSSDSIISYQDIHPRSYYMPYNEETNTDGYSNDNQRRNREFGLLERAVDYVNNNCIIPDDLDLDYDNDGLVDNICFILKGTYTGWSDLLWPHKWSIYDRNVYLNNTRVYTFNLQLEGSGSHYFSTSTFCHEMFHTLGAPDLYHYNNYTNVNSVGIWDLMCNNTTPPQHMGMYMKMIYGNWIDSVPEITEAGTYTLRSVGDNVHSPNQCYRIQSGDPTQWYYLEFRDNLELFEEGLPGSGMLIYRIDRRYSGNANFDASEVFDEVYLFSPGGINDTTPGYMAQAFFSSQAGRPEFSPSTNPFPWLTGNVIDTTIQLSNITIVGDSLTFTYTPHRPQTATCDNATCPVTVVMTDSEHDTWNGAYLSFETVSGENIANISLGDGKGSETKTLPLCNEPVMVRWNEGTWPQECGYTIYLADGSEWLSTSSAGYSGLIGTIDNPCGSAQTIPINIISANPSAGSVSGSGNYIYGDSATLTAIPNPGYAFDYWKRTSDNATFYDNPLHILVTIPDTYRAFFKTYNGIGDADIDVSVFSSGMTVVVNNAEGRVITITDILGRVVAEGTATSSSASYNMPGIGVYIVRIDNTSTHKVIVK